MKCTYCESTKTKVTHTDDLQYTKRRWRKCTKCGKRFRTIEIYKAE